MNCWKVYKYDVVESTNKTAKDICVDNLERFVVTADVQTDGKGQYGRKWVSPSGENLLATFCIPQHEIPKENIISFATANAICELLKKYGLAPKCKWPNDIEIDNIKIAGILTEKIDKWILIGIGLNINWPKKVSILKNGNKYTSIFAETGEKFKADSFILTLGDELYYQLKQTLNYSLKLYRSLWDKKINIEVLVDKKWMPAKQIGIDPDGTLITETIEGHTYNINTSARIRVRPTPYAI